MEAIYVWGYEGRLLQLLDALQLSRHVSQEADFHFANPQLPSCYLYIQLLQYASPRY